MSAPSHAVIAFAQAEADQKAAASLALGFQRDGTRVDQVSRISDVLDLLAKPEDDRPDIVVASLNLEEKGDGLALVQAVRAAHDPGVRVELARPPVILVGDGARRDDALAAGASAFIDKPAFVKDVVTLAGILVMSRDGLEPGWGGDLGALHLYYVVRALGAARRTGVLTLVRAEARRRGELRFYDGEVTSAQLGSLHGQAAFHQLLLWPEAHFDLRAEQVIRRQQIPLSPSELLVDAERFLRDYQELASGIAPSAIYEQDVRRAAEHADEIPKEVTPVLRLFDGLRSIADVIEDSPVRLAETLKVVKKLIAVGVLKKLGAPRPHAETDRSPLVEAWVVASGPSDGRPVPIEPKAVPRPAADWGLSMSPAMWGAASYAPVVPSQSAKGEISVGAPEVTAASSSDMITTGGQGNGEGVDPGTVRQNGKTRHHAGDGRPQPQPRKGGSDGHLAPEAVTTDDAPPPPSPAPSAPSRDETDTVPSRPVPMPAASGELAPAAVRARSPDRFEDHEEAFFREEESFENAEPPASESFDDLDDGHPQPGFWKRLFGKRKP
jgi:DNA-binding response OmpR family regulator